MRSQILVSFLVPSIFWYVMEVLAADDQRAVHFRGDDGTSKDTATDGDFASEGAFLI